MRVGLPVPKTLPHYHPLCYNYIMDNQSGGQSSSDRARETAANIMRKKVLDAYSDDDWKKYHTAWQNYYQRYYSDYYSKAAREYVSKERAKLQPSGAIVSPPDPTPTSSKDNDASILSQLKSSIQSKAKKPQLSAKKKKLIPLIAGISVTLLILFLQYNRLVFAPIAAYVSPGDAPATSITAIDPTVTAQISPDPKLLIPKINVDVPVAFGIKLAEVNQAMRVGVAHYRIAGASAYPGEKGNVVITGHSAGDVYNNDPYKFIFAGLERLEAGDLIYVNYQSKRYTYSVVKKSVVEPTDVAALTESFDKPMIILVTCTPLGVSRYRLLVFAEQIDPSSDGAISNEPITNPSDVSLEMPANEPSFFAKIWNWITGKD